MLLDLKGIFLFGLLALAQASPVSVPGAGGLEARAKGKKVTDVICDDGQRLTAEDVGLALRAARNAADESVGYPSLSWWYPHFFGNQPPVFPAQAELRSFPIIPGGTFTGKH
jgi:hypothetical protein